MTNKHGMFWAVLSGVATLAAAQPALAWYTQVISYTSTAHYQPFNFSVQSNTDSYSAADEIQAISTPFSSSATISDSFGDTGTAAISGVAQLGHLAGSGSASTSFNLDPVTGSMGNVNVGAQAGASIAWRDTLTIHGPTASFATVSMTVTLTATPACSGVGDAAAANLLGGYIINHGAGNQVTFGTSCALTKGPLSKTFNISVTDGDVLDIFSHLDLQALPATTNSVTGARVASISSMNSGDTHVDITAGSGFTITSDSGFNYSQFATTEPPPVPAPATLSLLLFGIVAAPVVRRTRLAKRPR